MVQVADQLFIDLNMFQNFRAGNKGSPDDFNIVMYRFSGQVFVDVAEVSALLDQFFDLPVNFILPQGREKIDAFPDSR